VPKYIQNFGIWLLSSPISFFAGLTTALDLHKMRLAERMPEIAVPILALHSVDDGYVPATAMAEIAKDHPEQISYHEFKVARHCKLWNYDQKKWESVISQWLEQF